MELLELQYRLIIKANVFSQNRKEKIMKRITSTLLALFMIISAFSFTVGAANEGEPTTQDMEAVIKLVKPRIYVPEHCSEFTWRFNAESAYNDASWRFTWSTKDEAEKNERVNVTCDADGNITNYNYRDYNKKYGQLPVYSKKELETVAYDFLKKALPEASANVKLYTSYGSGIYSGEYVYNYVRYIDDYLFPDNYINVTVDYNTGKIVSLSAEYDYELDIERHETLITPEKAEEILGTRQKMELTYLTKTDINKDTKERTIKAFLVYRPMTSYLAVDAGTGEIYDTKSSWSVNDSIEGGAGGDINAALKGESAPEYSQDSEYVLTDEELAGLKELEGLISKEEAIKAVTENEYLYIDPALTAVTANLNKNYGFEKTSTHRNDNGSYIWYINFTNPVIDGKYYSYAYADASVNAETGEIISFNCNLNDYYYYSNNKMDIPDVKFDADASRIIAENFLKSVASDKFENTIETDYHAQNVINRIDKGIDITENIYGAHSYRYTRVNESIKFSNNYINVGVDGVTGKVFNFNMNWWTNVEFESPKNAMTPEEALSSLLSCDGYGLIYERNIAYIYNPVTENSKKDVCAAFLASLTRTFENGGDIDKIIDKYAKNIDRNKLNEYIKAKDEESLFDLICAHFGVSIKDVQDSASQYVDTSMFYDRQASARLVYTCYDLGSEYISPFTGKQLTRNGEEYKKPLSEYSYSDLAGHWIEKDALLLSDIGIGFEGGKFDPDKNISVKEFITLSQSMNLYTSIEEKDADMSRIEAIKLIVDSLGYEKIAKIGDIYKTDFADNGEIKSEDIGYVAISYGLGIIKGDGTNVNAYSDLTRAQAVSLLINAVKAFR